MSTEKNTTWFIYINLNYSLLRINNTQMSPQKTNKFYSNE